MAHWYRKRNLTPVLSKEIPIKISRKLLGRLMAIKKKKYCVWRKGGPLYTVRRNVNWYSHYKEWYVVTTWAPVLVLGTQPKELEPRPQDPGVPPFTATWLCTLKTWKQPKCAQRMYGVILPPSKRESCNSGQHGWIQQTCEVSKTEWSTPATGYMRTLEESNS